MSNDEFKHESLEDPQSVVRYLRAIVEGFESGRLVLSNPQAQLELEPRSLVRLDIKARRRADRSKLTLKLRWKHVAAPPMEQSNSLTIQGGET